MPAFRTLVLAVALASLSVGVGCSPPAGNRGGDESPSGDRAAGPQVEVYQVGVRKVEHIVEMPGSIEPDQMVNLYPRVEGYVASVQVNIGQTVTENQKLIVITNPHLDAEANRLVQMIEKKKRDLDHRRTEVQLATAQLEEYTALIQLRSAELKRIDGLVQSGSLEASRLDEARFAMAASKATLGRGNYDIKTAESAVRSAQAAVKVADAELASARVLAGYRQITAPFTGVVVERRVNPGAFVRPENSKDGMPLLKIVSIAKVRLVVFVPMEDSLKLSDGDKVAFHNIQGLPNVTVEGKITRHAKAFHDGSRMMRAEVDLNNPLDERTNRRLITPGDFGTAKVTLQSYDSLPVIPRSALIDQSGTPYVVVVDASNVCHIRNVTTEYQNQDRVVIKSGIEAGQRVVAKNGAELAHQQQLPANAIKTVTD